MRPVPTGTIGPREQGFVTGPVTANVLKEAGRLRLQNDRARTSLPVDAKRPGGSVKVAD
jgi:hypothetical protein